MSQKESEWEKEFDKQFPPTIVKKEFVDALNEVLGTVGKYVPETATEIVIAQNAENARLRVKAFIRELLSNREKEIADEVEEEVNLEQLKRYRDEDSKLAHNSYGAGHSFGRWEMADKILQILKH